MKPGAGDGSRGISTKLFCSEPNAPWTAGFRIIIILTTNYNLSLVVYSLGFYTWRTSKYYFNKLWSLIMQLIDLKL